MADSTYVNDQRREYSLYVLQMRAIPHVADGLKAAARRVLWTARNGKHFKSATLAGATMPIHPHAAPEGAINTLAAPYGNNIPLLKGEGAFGTLLRPTAYGASRYTAVSVSEFTKDVVFKDIEIVPMQENYDGTLEEPKHFLPLVPVALLNPQEGIAVGFASSILPREPRQIITDQLKHLRGGKNDIIFDDYPAFERTYQWAQDWTEDKNGNYKWIFRGMLDRINATTIRVRSIPYGLTHEKAITKIENLMDDGKIVDVEDNSKDVYDIAIRFKKGFISRMDDIEILQYLGLEVSLSENMNVIDFDGERVWSADYIAVIQKFTDWRLEWYVARYQRLADLLEIDIQRYKDILLAIRKNIGGVAKRIQSRAELKEYLLEIGVVHVDYIADLPVYRFTNDEKDKVTSRLKAAKVQMREYQKLLRSKKARKDVYIEELQEVLNNLGKYYAET